MIIIQISFSSSNQRYLIAPHSNTTFYLYSLCSRLKTGLNLRQSVAAEWCRETQEGSRRVGPQTTTKTPDCHLDPIWKLSPTHTTTETDVHRQNPVLTYTNTYPALTDKQTLWEPCVHCIHTHSCTHTTRAKQFQCTRQIQRIKICLCD